MMSNEHIKALQEALDLKQRELDLVMAIDKIRDALSEPTAMLTAIVTLLAERLEAEACLLFLINRETGALELKGWHDESPWWREARVGVTRFLIEHTARLAEVVVWVAPDVLPTDLRLSVPTTLQLMVAPIIIGEEERLGTIVLARSERPFDRRDMQLLKTAEDQIDSAVMQGYAQSKLNLKQRALDLIVAIDEIRDTLTESGAMLAAIVRLLAENLATDVCRLYLFDHKRGALGLRAAHDKRPWEARVEQPWAQAVAERTLQDGELNIWTASETASPLSPESLHWAAMPVILRHERLGVILLARANEPFGLTETQLLKTAEDQIDSAIIQGYTKSKLEWKQKELDFIAAIDEIRDSTTEPAEMLSAIVTLLVQQLEADACWLFLAEPETKAMELKAAHDRSVPVGQLERWLTPELAERALHLSEITVWEGREIVGAIEAGRASTLQIVAVPIIMGQQQRLGAILVARSEQPFSPGDILLLRIAEDQIDSAIVQGYAYDKLRQHTLELETIFRIDRIRDQGLPLDAMLKAVIGELRATIEAEIGFVMLYDRAGRELEMRASTYPDQLYTLPYYETIQTVVRESLDRAELVSRQHLSSALRSIMCLPLILNENIIGVLGMINRQGVHGFTTFDRRLLAAIGSQIDTAIYERNEIGLLRQVLGRAIDPHVLDRLLANSDVDFLKGEHLELTILYADLRGSTALAERTKPEQLVEFIKDYLEHMTGVILEHEGTVDKFVGDEVMALFGAPVPQADHASRAVRVGLAMQSAYSTIQQRWQERGLMAPLMGIGIATGKVIAGEMGGPQRTQYTVIGRAANLGARICGEAQGGQVLICPRTYEMAKDTLEAMPFPGRRFKGVAEDITVYQVERVVNV